MKSAVKFSFAAAAAVIIIIVGVFVINKLSEKPKEIIRIGQIEMRQYDVASKVPGRIEWIKVSEGDAVNAGDELFKLTDREIKAKVAQAEGAVISANAQYNMALEGTRSEQIEMAERKFIADKSQFELAEKTYKRMKNLYSDKLISSQDFDVIEQKYKAAGAAMEASEAQ